MEFEEGRGVVVGESDDPRGNLWRRHGGLLLGGVLASAIWAVITTLFGVYAAVSPGNPIAFRVLLALSAVTPLLVVGVAILLLARIRSIVTTGSTTVDATLRSGLAEVTGSLDSLNSKISATDWCFDKAEHEVVAYQRLAAIVRDQRTRFLHVATVFRDAAPQEVQEAQNEAIADYYRAIEDALQNRGGFEYRRNVVIRGTVGGEGRGKDQLFTDLIGARPGFLQHCANVLAMEGGENDATGRVEFFVDTGRLLDLAFLVALDANKKPLKLVLEIGMTSPGRDDPRHPLLGLLIVDNPDGALAGAFLSAHRVFRADVMRLERVSAETVRSVLPVGR